MTVDPVLGDRGHNILQYQVKTKAEFSIKKLLREINTLSLCGNKRKLTESVEKSKSIICTLHP